MKASVATARAAARLSMATNGRSPWCGPPCTATGRPVAATAGSTGSSSLVVQTTNPSTAASATRSVSDGAPVMGTIVSPRP